MEQDHSGVYILLVNDRPAQLLAWQAVLDGSAHELVFARSGDEALDQLLGRDFAVILLDVNMPGMDGFETAALIRQRPRCEHTPILFVTAINTDERDRVRGYALGAVDYIFTPIVPEVLRAKVDAFVELYRVSQEVAHQAARLSELNQVLEIQLDEIKGLNAELSRANAELRAESAERRRAEAHLRRAHAELEDRVRERTAALAQSNSELQAANDQLAGEMAERRRSELRLAAQFIVTRSLAQAASFAEAGPDLVAALAQNLAWDIGEIWLADQANGTLARMCGWHVPGDELREFDAASQRMTLQSESSVPGRVWASGEPLWLPDLNLATGLAFTPRVPYATEAGLQTVFAYPLRDLGVTFAILCFFSRRSRAPDPDLYNLLASVASQVGQFLDRRRAEAALHEAHAALEQRVRERTAELAEANTELDRSREQLRRLTAHIEALREEERARIAREVHDDLGGALTGLKLDVARMRRAHIDGAIAASPDFDQLSAAIDRIIQSVRRIATELRPAILDDFGLPAAIEWQLNEFTQRSGIVSNLDICADELPLVPDTATALFRVFQEALTNVARHAQASQVDVTLQILDGHVELQVEDNGRGIEPNVLRQTRSFGLVGMRERVRLLAGELSISGLPGEGTTVIVRVPLHSPVGSYPQPIRN